MHNIKNRSGSRQKVHWTTDEFHPPTDLDAIGFYSMQIQRDELVSRRE